MSNFGWSYPPGAANDPCAPYNQDFQPVDLRDDKTLNGYGRRQHGLNGKDADLCSGGQNVIEEAWWFEDHIEITGYRYASICPPEESTDDDGRYQSEMVADCGYDAEWSDDYWIVTDHYQLVFKCETEDEKTALKAAYKAILKNSKPFEVAMTSLSRAMEESVIPEEEAE